MLSETEMEPNIIEELHVAKGKRTKRRLKHLSRSSPSPTAAVTNSSCSSASGGGAGSSSSTTFEGTDQEEEDMANCLILLARGGDKHNPRDKQLTENSVTGDDSNGNGNRIGFYVYECKTCNRSFPSFQALGGHRASHKKPKMTVTEEEKKSPQPQPQPRPQPERLCEFGETKDTSQMKISLQLGCGGNNRIGGGNFNGNKSKIHECSICGSEFNSGQALGGHMRRHRASTGNNNAVPVSTHHVVDAIQATNTVKPHRNVLELDLNLPAPAEDVDLRDTKFPFPVASPALVGCHY